MPISWSISIGGVEEVNSGAINSYYCEAFTGKYGVFLVRYAWYMYSYFGIVSSSCLLIHFLKLSNTTSESIQIRYLTEILSANGTKQNIR